MATCEPFYCRVCGAEEGDCAHSYQEDGAFCEIDGIIHTPEYPCPFEEREEVDHELP